MAEVQARVTRRRRIPLIWLVPIVALALGIWMVIHTYRSQGPEITISFDSGSGIEGGKTKIMVRSVEVGLVETVGLDTTLEEVVVTARIHKEATSLLRDDTEFWVVRPRVGPGGVSGLGTLLSGAYIQLAPGTGEEGQRNFAGLDGPPVTPAGTPGLKINLVSDTAGSVTRGNPILYKGFRVGTIESAEFDVPSQKMHYGAFIESPYDELISSATRFWDASGISVSATADGVQVQTGSLETVLIGGVACGLPEGVEPGRSVVPGELFDLYPNHASMNEQPYRFGLEYVVRFTQSVRGLKPGAPVEYRGIRMGEVKRVLLTEAVGAGLHGEGSPIPVLIRLEPGRIGLPDSEEGEATLSRVIEGAVRNGMRGTLATGSLLSGSLYVYFDRYPNEPAAAMETFADHPTIPTIASGLAGIEVRITTLLDKLNALPVGDTLDGVDRVLADLSTILESEQTRALPGSLEATLAELRGALGSVSADSELQERLLRTMGSLDRSLQDLRQFLRLLDEKPNALIFSGDQPADPEPPAGSP